MSQTVKVKNSTQAGKIPAAGALETAELALNLVDQKLYSKDNNGTVFQIGKAPNVSVDLGYQVAANDGTITNTAGASAVIPVADTGNAGLMAPEFVTKLNGIQQGAQKNPDLSTYLEAGDNVSDLDNDAGYITLGEVPVVTNVSELNNDAGYITLGEVPEVTGFVKLEDGGTAQSVVGGGGLDVAGPVVSSGGVYAVFGDSDAQQGNVAPLNDWSCYPARA